MSVEASYPTVGSDQVNAFYFPIKESGAGWVALATIATQFAQAQMDRLQNIGIGAYDLSIRKRHEIGRTPAMQKVAPSTIDKPVTLEWLEYGALRVWNNFCGKDTTNTGDITQDDFDATLSEGLLIVHRLDEAKANVMGSDVLIRTVIENDGMSVPATEDDDLHCSVRLVGDEYFQTSNDAAMAVAFFDVAAVSVWTAEIAYNAIVERDDWPDNDDGTNARTVLTANPGAAATVLVTNDNSNFSVGDIVVIETTAIYWETTKITAINVDGFGITVQDGIGATHDVGSQIRRTRGFFLKVHNNDGSGYLEHCTDYRVAKTDANTLTIINVDGGSEIGATDNIWACWCVNSGSELWTDNDSDVYGITHPMCTLEVSPEATFNSSTIGYDGVAVTEDTELDFASSGTDVDTEWYAYMFTTPAARVGKVDYVEFNLSKSGAGGGGWVTASIYTDNAGVPADAGELGNPSEPVLISTITAAGTMDRFSFTHGPSLAAATTYHVVLKTHGYTYTDGVTDLMWNVDANGDVASDKVIKGDPNATPIFTVNHTDHGAEVNVALIASQWVRRLNGMDISNSYSRKRVDEMGTSIPVERPFDETEVRITLPKSGSDETTWARLTQKNIASVKTMVPEQNPEVWVRLKVYSTEAKADDDLLLSYEFPQVQRTGGERSIPVNDNVQERITLTGDQRTIATSL